MSVVCNPSNHFHSAGYSQDGGRCSRSLRPPASSPEFCFDPPFTDFMSSDVISESVDIFEPGFLTCNRTIPERWRGPTLRSYSSRSSATLPPLWYHEHQTSGSTLCIPPQVHLQSQDYQTVNNTFSVLRPSLCWDRSLWRWLACVQLFCRGGSVLTRLFVGWFASRITQKLLNRFPQVRVEDGSQPRTDLSAVGAAPGIFFSNLFNIVGLLCLLTFLITSQGTTRGAGGV